MWFSERRRRSVQVFNPGHGGFTFLFHTRTEGWTVSRSSWVIREREKGPSQQIFHSNLTQRHRLLLWARWKGDSGVKEEFNSLVLRSAGIRGDLDKIFSLLSLLCVGTMRERRETDGRIVHRHASASSSYWSYVEIESSNHNGRETLFSLRVRWSMESSPARAAISVHPLPVDLTVFTSSLKTSWIFFPFRAHLWCLSFLQTFWRFEEQTKTIQWVYFREMGGIEDRC